MTTIKNASPATVSIDMTADTARHMLRGSAPLVAHFDSLTAKAEALDALLQCCQVVAMRCVLDDDRYYHEADAKRFYAALEAAKIASAK